MGRFFHARSSGMLELLSLMAPSKPVKKKRAQGRWRCHAILTEAQVLEILDIRQKHGWSAKRIAAHMGIPQHQADGVIYGGNGIRTVLIK